MQYRGTLGDHIAQEVELNDAAIFNVIDYAWNVSGSRRMRRQRLMGLKGVTERTENVQTESGCYLRAVDRDGEGGRSVLC